MVHCQIRTLEHLMDSGYGRPFPRHGLQLLFWFANHCVTCELINFVVIMKLVSDCQPERGFYGFHLFGNIEELLPVLNRPRRRKSKRQGYNVFCACGVGQALQPESVPGDTYFSRNYHRDMESRLVLSHHNMVLYFVVGNLSTETYPASANLPTYVRENYGLDDYSRNNNIDRIIVSYQLRTRVVETLYVTEHDRAAFGRFSTDRTFEIHPELIQALQRPQLDLTTFLTQTGYYGDIQVVQANDMEEIHYTEPSAQQMFNILQNYSGSTAGAEHYGLGFFSEAFNQHLNVNIEPFSYDQHVQYIVNVTSPNSGLVACNSEVQHKYRKRKANKRPRALRQSYWLSEWEGPLKDFDAVKKRNEGGGVSFVKILLSAGMLYLAAKGFSWLRSWWKWNFNENILRMMPWRTPTHQYHIMLDYVY